MYITFTITDYYFYLLLFLILVMELTKCSNYLLDVAAILIEAMMVIGIKRREGFQNTQQGLELLLGLHMNFMVKLLYFNCIFLNNSFYLPKN